LEKKKNLTVLVNIYNLIFAKEINYYKMEAGKNYT